MRAAAGVTLLALLHVAYYFPRVVDDVFISLRYAESLASGGGAVYNPGERVEGYSSPAFMLLQALAALLGLEPITSGKLAGIACLLATAYGVRALAIEVYGVARVPAWIPAVACALNPYLVSWSVLGLETPLHVAMLVLCPLAVHRALAAPAAWSRPTCVAAAALVVLGITRPESALYVAITVLAPFAAVRERRELGPLIRRSAAFVVPAGLVLALLLAVRFAYYGELVPNTYHVKGAHAAFALGKLGGLVREGTSPIEALFFCGGAALVVVASARTRAVAPGLSLLACLYFTASVAVDWMPNLRHLVPVTVLAPIGWAWAVGALEQRGKQAASFTATALAVATGLQLASVDVRLSPIEHVTRWVVRKSLAKWSDTMLAYRRVEPPHVKAMGPYEMGQITQAWGVLEASGEPVASSWWAGRDIGAVGYLTGVRVFDTAGLVTREVSRSEAWSARGEVPCGGEVDRKRPTDEEVLRRYRALVAKMPRLYHLHTLYGESMGAAAERRLRIVTEEQKKARP